MAKRKGSENLKMIQSTEEARSKGSKGGKKSGETRRAKRDAKATIRLFMEMAAQGDLDKLLKANNIPENERTNMMAGIVKLFEKTKEGDVNAFKALMDYGGYAPDQSLRDKERQARIGAIEKSAGASSVTSQDEDGGVVIYLPELDDKAEQMRNAEGGEADADS